MNTVDWDEVAKLKQVMNDFEIKMSREKKLVRTVELTTNKKVPRNSKCLCGSGKKYKKCCSE